MGNDDYVKAFEAATREMETLMKERADLAQRILHVRQTLVSLSRLCGFTPTVSWGMTDGVRFILRRAQPPMSAVDVRADLANWGFDMSRYANGPSGIHTVLKRLNKAGEIRSVPRGAGSDAYEWMRPTTPVKMTTEKPSSPKAKK